MSIKNSNIEDFLNFILYFFGIVYPISIIMMSMAFGFILLSQHLFGPSSGHHIMLCILTFSLFSSVFLIRVRKNHILGDAVIKSIYIALSVYWWFNTLKSLNNYTIYGKIDPLIPFNIVQEYVNVIEKVVLFCIIVLFTNLIMEGSIHVFHTWKNKKPLFRSL